MRARFTCVAVLGAACGWAPPEATPGSHDLTITYGSYAVVGADGTSPGKVWGYQVNGEFGLPTMVAAAGQSVTVTVHNNAWEPVRLSGAGFEDVAGAAKEVLPEQTETYQWVVTDQPGAYIVRSIEQDEDGVEYQARAGLAGVLRVLAADEAPSQMLTMMLVDLYEPWTEGLPGEAPDDGHDHEHRSQAPPDAEVDSGGDTGDSSGGIIDTLGAATGTLITQAVTGEDWSSTDTREGAGASVFPGEVAFNVAVVGGEVHSLHLGGLTWDDGSGAAQQGVVIGPGMATAVTAGTVPDSGQLTVQCTVDDHRAQEISWLTVHEH